MRFLTPLLLFGFAGAVAAAPLSSEGTLAIHSVTADRQAVPRYEKLELRLNLSATYNNPFDPDEIDVQAHFRAPSGKEITIPGFLYQSFTRTREGKAERLTAGDATDWRVRFTPTETGTYTYTVTARDRSGKTTSPAGHFRCTASKHSGFVRISKADPRYFAFDNGAPYFAVGANVCWAGNGGTYEFDEWFSRYAAVGGNYARLWIGPFDLFTLERKQLPNRADTGLGRYDLMDAWRLDHVLQLAEQQGLYLMFCIDSFNSLRISPPYAWWKDNPYNAANGGMLAKPEEFFTNAEARRIFRNRLRYMAARWGYSPNLLSWEFWNEVDIIEKYISPDVKAWHQEMSRYLRGVDPWKHLQTTSYARSEGDPAVDGLPEMDYVQTHRYGPRDMGAEIGAWTLRKRAAFNKPHYVGEFGLDVGGAGGERDPEGVSLHNGLWASVMNGAAGAAMLWWWDSYIHPRNLYGHYAALTAFTKGIDWPRAQFRPAKGMDIDFVRRPSAPDLLDLVLQGQEASWSPSPANQPNSFTLTRTGTIAGLDRLAKVLHGVANHRDLHNPATFLVDYPSAGRFLVNVRGVSGFGGAGLKLTLDGQTVLEKDFPDTDAAGTDTLNQYNGVYPVDVPAGKHTIVVENTGRDWLYVDYLLPAYRESMLPRLRAQGLTGSRMSIAWVQNSGHTWSLLADKVQPKPQQGAELRLPVARAGRYRVELWDTYTGKQLQTLTLKAAGGRLTIPLPTIEKDLALKAIFVP